MILVTGAAGFVGKALCKRLLSQDQEFIRVVRNGTSKENEVVIQDISVFQDWGKILEGVNTVIHLAGRAHVFDKNNFDSIDKFYKINTTATANLAKQSAKHGVKRFIFLSSIGVNGNFSLLPFSEQDQPRPSEIYSISKFKAEQEIIEICAHSEMEYVIVRPPLIYDVDAPGNFGNLMCFIERGLPLPLGSLKKKRSFISLDNAVDFILLCARHPKAANEIFLIADGEDISIPDLLILMAKAIKKPCRLISIPPWMIMLGATLLGRRGWAHKILVSLEIDISKARTILGWTPKHSIHEKF